MKRYSNKYYYWLLLLILILFFSKNAYNYYNEFYFGYQNKYVIVLDEINPNQNIEDLLKTYSILSNEYDLEIEIVNNDNEFKLKWTDNYFVTIGLFSKRDQCLNLLQNIVDRYKFDVLAVKLDSTVNSYPEYIITKPSKVFSFNDNFSFNLPFISLKNTVIENSPNKSLNNFPKLNKNDTIFCDFKSIVDNFCMCKIEKDTTYIYGYVNMLSIKSIDDLSYFDLKRKYDSLNSILVLKSDTIDILSQFMIKSAKEVDSLKTYINQKRNEIIVCFQKENLIIKSYNKKNKFYLSTKLYDGTWSDYKEYKIDEKSQNSTGFLNTFEKKIGIQTIYRYYVVDNEGRNIIGDFYNPVVSSVCSQKIIYLPK